MDGHVPLPDLAAVVADIILGIFVLGGGLGGADLLADQVPVRHAPDLQVQAVDVHRLQPHPVGILPRQDHPLAGKAHIGRLGAGDELHIGVLGQGFATCGRQAAQQGHGPPGIAHIGHAQLIVMGGHRRRMAQPRADRHEVPVGLPRIKGPGHADAGRRGGAVGVEPTGPDGEAVGLARRGPGGVGGAGLAEQGPGGAVPGGLGHGGGRRGRGHPRHPESGGKGGQDQPGDDPGPSPTCKTRHDRIPRPCPAIICRPAPESIAGWRNSVPHRRPF